MHKHGLAAWSPQRIEKKIRDIENEDTLVSYNIQNDKLSKKIELLLHKIEDRLTR